MNGFVEGIKTALGMAGIGMGMVKTKRMNPMEYLDKFIETMGAEPVEKYDKKVSCCGGALAFSEPEKSQALIKDIIEAAWRGHDRDAVPGLPDECRSLPGQDQRQVRYQVQHAGDLLQHVDVGCLRQKRQGCGS